ncbi:hypothetical protein ERJ75_001239000 [Trypanosoma vivax]|nr:hypothetical protein TRVL_08166 [Trypanosoma vivax]KAH8609011.1 hypothetical protein ERJ75_001239000 [Trypanosoma vivax]
MFLRSLVRLVVTKAAAESYMEYLQNADRELPALSEIFPRHQSDTKELIQFHSLLSEVMQEHGFKYVGIKVVPPSATALRCLRATDAICVPIFSNVTQKTSISVKQDRIQFVEPLFVMKLGCDPPTQMTASKSLSICDTFCPGVDLTGSRYPFYPPHTTGFAADLGGTIAIHFGDNMNLTDGMLESLADHSFVMTREGEPIQVGSVKNCLGGPGAAVPLAVSYASSIGLPLRAGHHILCNGVGSRTPALPGEYKVNFGVYGSVSVCVT